MLASILDTLALFTVLLPSRFLFGSAITLFGMDAQISVRRIVRIVLGITIAWAYKAGMESSRCQATLGKIAMRLKVTDLEDRRVSLARATARHFAKYLSAIALLIGYLMVAFDEQKQGLHDQIAGTLVQRR